MLNYVISLLSYKSAALVLKELFLSYIDSH